MSFDRNGVHATSVLKDRNIVYGVTECMTIEGEYCGKKANPKTREKEKEGQRKLVWNPVFGLYRTSERAFPLR